jgi:hypothetical protein
MTLSHRRTRLRFDSTMAPERPRIPGKRAGRPVWGRVWPVATRFGAPDAAQHPGRLPVHGEARAISCSDARRFGIGCRSSRPGCCQVGGGPGSGPARPRFSRPSCRMAVLQEFEGTREMNTLIVGKAIPKSRAWDKAYHKFILAKSHDLCLGCSPPVQFSGRILVRVIRANASCEAGLP